MKKCIKCSEDKPESCYYKHPRLKGKTVNECKKCAVIRVGNYTKKNRGKVKEYQAAYYEANKEEILAYNRKRDKKKRSADGVYKLKYNLSHNLRMSLKSKNLSKTNRITELLGCGFEELIHHLNSNPYGFTYGDKGIDIDHINPTSSALTKEDLEGLFHYTNLQLLPSYYNRHIKKNLTFNREEFEEWLKTIGK